jgi:hypothetical protein
MFVIKPAQVEKPAESVKMEIWRELRARQKPIASRKGGQPKAGEDYPQSITRPNPPLTGGAQTTAMIVLMRRVARRPSRRSRK